MHKILFTSIAAWRAVLPLITLQMSGLAPACNKHLKISNYLYKNLIYRPKKNWRLIYSIQDQTCQLTMPNLTAGELT